MSPILVVKLGGSLLDWPEWPERLLAYLASRSKMRPVLMIGGGRFADVLRDLDQSLNLGEARAHALALRVLDTTAHLAAALLPQTVVVTTIQAIQEAWQADMVPIFAPRSLLDKQDRESHDPLPHAWTTTTDSIAARLADILNGAELVLLKSCPLPSACSDWETAAALGLVDSQFPRSTRNLAKVSIVCLREQISQMPFTSSSVSGRSVV